MEIGDSIHSDTRYTLRKLVWEVHALVTGPIDKTVRDLVWDSIDASSRGNVRDIVRNSIEGVLLWM